MSMVPMGGMNSAEWEEFKMWFQLDKVAYYLKRKMGSLKVMKVDMFNFY